MNKQEAALLMLQRLIEHHRWCIEKNVAVAVSGQALASFVVSLDWFFDEDEMEESP